ncbi:MAG: 3-hydroxyacyl-ACP dehydratase FabZ [Thermoleophilia bacterium]
MNAGVALTREQIEELIPHRHPFLLLDEVVELIPGERCHARRLVRADDWWFAGHFPGNPVMPGVLIVEALAQAGVVTALSHPANRGKLILFAGIDKVRFKRVVTPGDTLDLEVEVTMARSAVGRGRVSATVDGDTACRGELMFAMADADETASGRARLSPGAGQDR